MDSKGREMIKEALERRGIPAARVTPFTDEGEDSPWVTIKTSVDIDTPANVMFALHQANLMYTEPVATRLKRPLLKFLTGERGCVTFVDKAVPLDRRDD